MDKLTELLIRIQKIKPDRDFNAIQHDMDILGFELNPYIIHRITLPDFRYRSDWNSNIYELIHECNLFLDRWEE
jgi:hypothetical protein